MKFLKKYPVFLLLLAVFFCLHGLVENYELIYIKSLALTFFYTILFIAVVYFLLKLILKNKIYTALVTFLSCGYILFFGAFLDFVKQFNLVAWLSKYAVFLTVSFLLLGFLFFVLKRKIVLQEKVFYFLNLLFIVYVLFDVISLIIKINSIKSDNNFDYAIDKKTVQATPNVYLLLFDEYAGYESLRDSFGFKNDIFYNNLQKKGFEIVPTTANYNMTFFSISSLLNMKLIDSNYNANKLVAKDDINRIKEIKNATVVDCFQEMGYHFYNYSIFDIKNMPMPFANSYVKTNTNLITNKILPVRLLTDLGWNLMSSNKNNSIVENYLNKDNESNVAIEDKILQTTIPKSAKPSFTYAHFLLPHFPYYYDSIGNKLSNVVAFNDKLIYDKNYYLSYLKYANTQIEKMVTHLVAIDSSAIIVTMSDHGFHSYKSNENKSVFFNNFCAIRSPNQYKVSLAGHKSMVNIFPCIFNQYFGQRFPYHTDSTIFLQYR